KMRYQFFEEQMIKCQADYLALGHHGDDQIETMLMELGRNADSSSFSGIPVQRPFSNGTIIRPLLCVTKNEIENYCNEHSITAKIDPAILETRYTRNYYRKYIVPKLTDKKERLHLTVQHMSETLNDDENYLTQHAQNMLNSVVTVHESEKKV